MSPGRYGADDLSLDTVANNLNATQREIAMHSGLTPREYAEGLQRMATERRLDPEKFRGQG
jgi:hypothetical protein